MAGQKNERSFYPIQFGGVLDESRTPSKVGGTGLTGVANLTYRRYGAWGKRAGSGIAYAAAAAGATSGQPSSGIRWYRDAPSPLTKLVVVAQGEIYIGDDPNLVSPYAPLNVLTTAANNSGQQASFASTYDPSDNGYVGGDILIICGLTGPFGFSTGNVTLSGTPAAGDIISFTLKWPTVPGGIAVSYTILPTDNLSSVAQALVALINASGMVNPKSLTIIPGPPPMNFSYATVSSGVATIHLGSLDSGVVGLGATGDQLQYNAFNVVGTSVTLSPTVSTHMTGGGLSVSAPLKYDGTRLAGLSYMIQQPFTGCASWHDHVWYWGDKANPYTLYASDINQPTGFVFMNTFDGYHIGPGDDAGAVQTCIPIGNIFYVFKQSAIYAVTGFDFQSGEYQFSVQLALNGTGIPAPGCATLTHNNTIIYWDSGKFYRLTVGSFLPEFIGRPIPLTSGKIAKGDPKLMRAVAGDFPALSALNNVYSAPGQASDSEIFSNVVMFACDVGNGVADRVLVYDDDASNFIGDYCWSVWTGWTVAAFIPFSNGENTAKTASDLSALFWVPSLAANAPLILNEYGVSTNQDAFNTGTPIGVSWYAGGAWDAFGTPALLKELHRILLDVEAVPGTLFDVKITASGPVNGLAQTTYPPTIFLLPLTVGTVGSEANQTLIGGVKPFLKGYKFMFSLSEPGLSPGFEVAGLVADYIVQAFEP